MKATIYHGECADVMREMSDASIDAVVCDPPYGLEFMGKEWDRFSGSVTDRDFKGFVLSQQRTRNVKCPECGRWAYDHPGRLCECGGIRRLQGTTFQQWCLAWAEEALRVLKPGGHLLAFGGTRTYHRLVCAIEDAGFEIRDEVMWLYGCLSDDTEILTDRGWVRHDQASEGQHALSFDLATGAVEWQRIQHVHRYWHDGEMVRLHSDQTDQLLTPNHRVVIDNIDTEPRIPYASDVRDLRDCGVEAECLGQADEGAFLLLPVQWDSARARVGDVRAPGKQSPDTGELREGSHAGSEESGVEGRRYRIQEARELCRSQVRASPRMGAADGSQGRLHHGAPPTDGGPVRVSPDTARGGASRESRSERQQTRESDSLAFQQRAPDVRRGPDGRRGLLSSTRVQADYVGYAGVVWCITVPHGAFIARRNGLIFATGNSGFPKSMDVSKAIDKAAGKAGTYGEPKSAAHKGWIDRGRMRGEEGHEGYQRPWMDDGEAVDRNARQYIPGSDDAAAWEGWGTALKPAHEPIVVARKPLIGTVASNVLQHGTGALNIDGCRIGVTDGAILGRRNKPGPNGWKNSSGGDNKAVSDPIAASGRWPANVILSHHEDCVEVGTKTIKGGRPIRVSEQRDDLGTEYESNAYAGRVDNDSLKPGSRALGAIDQEVEVWECVEDCPVRMLDAQTGTLKSGKAAKGGHKRKDSMAPDPNGVYEGNVDASWKQEDAGQLYGDVGGASRFFYCAKTSSSERNAGLKDQPNQGRATRRPLKTAQCKVCGSKAKSAGQGEKGPNCGHDDFEWVDEGTEHKGGTKNDHPTVKPIALMRYLVRLVTPPGGVVLDPFLGSGTTAIAAHQEGFDCIGIDKDRHYIDDIAEPRATHFGVEVEVRGFEDFVKFLEGWLTPPVVPTDSEELAPHLITPEAVRDLIVSFKRWRPDAYWHEPQEQYEADVEDALEAEVGLRKWPGESPCEGVTKAKKLPCKSSRLTFSEAPMCWSHATKDDKLLNSKRQWWWFLCINRLPRPWPQNLREPWEVDGLRQEWLAKESAATLPPQVEMFDAPAPPPLDSVPLIPAPPPEPIQPETKQLVPMVGLLNFDEPAPDPVAKVHSGTLLNFD